MAPTEGKTGLVSCSTLCLMEACMAAHRGKQGSRCSNEHPKLLTQPHGIQLGNRFSIFLSFVCISSTCFACCTAGCIQVTTPDLAGFTEPSDHCYSSAFISNAVAANGLTATLFWMECPQSHTMGSPTSYTDLGRLNPQKYQEKICCCSLFLRSQSF